MNWARDAAAKCSVLHAVRGRTQMHTCGHVHMYAHYLQQLRLLDGTHGSQGAFGQPVTRLEKLAEY